MSLPTVDVAVPCYRYGAMLPTAVGSVLEQEGVQVRVRIIDDASDDDSADVARELAAADPRVDVEVHEVNRGHIATFTEGAVEWPEAEYTVLMSADDALTPGALRRATAIMTAHPEVVLVYGPSISWFGELPLPPARTGHGTAVVHRGADWLRMRFEEGANCVASPTAVTRTSVQKQVGGYDPDLLHTSDLDMWMRMAMHGDVGFVADADQAYCRGHAANMSVAYEESDGGLGDLQMRLRAFLAVLAKADGRLDGVGGGPAALERTVRRRLASEALLRVARSYDKGSYDERIAGGLIAFAEATVDDVRSLPHWRSLQLRRRIGAKAMPNLRYLVLPAVARRFRQLGRERRLSRRGV
ncbi:glycosyltransferase [Pseudonocardia sp. CA-107938]|uniref:glycosyltransferase n=1 Tax=Pseudonocardia sp. CA-107938 TaxID=3240021 RepID=UPI003D8C6A39